MSQNINQDGANQGQGAGATRSTGGAGTGATDAGTTRAPNTGTTGSTGATGSSQGLAPSTGNAGSGGTGTGTATALASTAQEYGQKIAEAASTAKDYVTDKVSVVGEKLKDLQNVDIGEVATQAKDYARQNPGQAILISAAAGFVLGLLIRSASRR